jgi:hypothetical protein
MCSVTTTTTARSRTHSPNSAPIRLISPPSSLHRRALQERLRVRRIWSSGCGEKCIFLRSEENLWDLMRRPNAVRVLYNPRWGVHPQVYSHSCRHMWIPGGEYTSPQCHYSLAGIPHPTWGHAARAFWPSTAPSTLALRSVPSTPKPSTSRLRGWWEHCPPRTSRRRRTTQPLLSDCDALPTPSACNTSPLPSARDVHKPAHGREQEWEQEHLVRGGEGMHAPNVVLCLACTCVWYVT